MKTKTVGGGLAVLVAAVLLTGCRPTSSPEPSPAPSITVSVSSSPSPTECGSCDGEPQADHTGVSGIGWDAAASTAVVKEAVAAMKLFNRPQVKADVWIRDLAGYMTNEAGTAYQNTDPANIPPFKLTGDPKLVVDEKNGYGADVVFSTTIGNFTFKMLRKSAASDFKLNEIAFPAGLH